MSLSLPESEELINSQIKKSVKEWKTWTKKDLLVIAEFYCFEYWKQVLQVKALNDYLEGNITSEQVDSFVKKLSEKS